MNNSTSSNLYMNVAEMEQKILLLKEEKAKMDAVFQNIISDAKGMINYWSGNTGEHAFNEFNEYTKKFQTISESMLAYITFLESSVSAYKMMDQTIKTKMETNANVSAV